MNRKILRLAIPNILSNLSVPLLGAVDTAIVGRLEFVYYLGAIAVGSVIFDFIFWGFGFLRMGTTGLVAQEYGADNEKQTRWILLRVLTVALGSSVAILLLQIPLIELSMKIIGASAEVEQYTRIYYNIRIFSAPATLCLFGLNGWFLGMQNAAYPMIVTIFLNGTNILLNLLFVLYFGMNVDGVAYGTLIASYLSMILAVSLYLYKYGSVKVDFDLKELLDTHELKRFFSVNRDILIRTLCLIFSYAFFTAKSAELGDTILAANTILLQMWYISSYGTDGFAYAAESLVGRFVGAKDGVNLIKAVKGTMVWGLSLGLLGTVTYYFLDREIIYLFTNKPEVINTALSMIIWLIIAPLINAVSFIWDGVFIGATATKPMRNSMLIATIIVFLPVYFIAEPYGGMHALWMAMTGFMVARGLILSLYAPKHIFKLAGK
ncbi:MATE family efflux transporter [Balneola sp. MJW-20]|uniref:MATE family efflux transporter n=1 Tax=Gracilimonas aurantiaca TaxID=3234185 RepID=UPI0034AFCFBF